MGWLSVAIATSSFRQVRPCEEMKEEDEKIKIKW
jgi:hypothetical protein